MKSLSKNVNIHSSVVQSGDVSQPWSRTEVAKCVTSVGQQNAVGIDEVWYMDVGSSVSPWAILHDMIRNLVHNVIKDSRGDCRNEHHKILSHPSYLGQRRGGHVVRLDDPQYFIGHFTGSHLPPWRVPVREVECKNKAYAVFNDSCLRTPTRLFCIP